jgi:TnpA family transposase
VATVVHLEGQAVDDALELLDLLMVAHLVGPAKRAVDRDNLKRYPRLSRGSATLAVAVEVLLKATEPGTDTTLHDVWERIEARVPRDQLQAALASVSEIVPPLGADHDIEAREGLTAKIATVRPFLALLCETIDFRATTQAGPVLAAMKDAGRLAGAQGALSVKEVNASLVTGSWKRLVFDKPGLKTGTVDKRAYAMCVLEQFHRLLRRREIYAPSSTRWGDPRAALLTGRRWELAKLATLTALRLPEDPTGLLADHAAALDGRYREVAGRFEANAAVNLDTKGRLHVQALDAVPEPPSLVDLRRRVEAMLPQVDVGELILEVMAWHPAMVETFTSVTGGEARLADLPVVIAAALTAQALNIGYTPIVKTGAISRARISHVDQNYLRAETYSPANVPLIEAQAGIGLAQAWGGGLVAAVDGMRFVVPVKSIYARPNSKYFGRDRGATWLNLINDQAAGLAGMVVPGTPRDSLHVLDLMYRQEGGAEPEILVSDMSSATDVIFGLVHLLGKQYRPAPADLPDERLWRTDPQADYGPLNIAARGRLDLDRPARHWPDMLRVVASVHTGEVLASQVMRILQRDGTLTPLGDAFAHFGRIFKSRHLLTYIDDPDYRRDIKAIRNLQEGRHSLAKHLCHGKQGQLHQRYQHGMEEQLGALGLVLNCVTLWNTVYMDAALARLRTDGYPVADDDVARLSPFPRKHINVHGTYTFALPDLPGGMRALRDPNTAHEDD